MERVHKSSLSPWLCITFRDTLVFYVEGLRALSLTPNLEDHPLSVLRNCLSNVLIFIGTSGAKLFCPQPEEAFSSD
jgi:hypothetical protein